MSRDFEVFRIERRDRVAIVTIDRPEKRNAMSPTFFRELPEVLDVLDADEAVRAVVLTGRRITAAEALTYHLVNEVVPQDSLDAAVDRWLEGILACAPLSVRAIKQSVRRTAHLSAQEAQAARLPALIEALQSKDQEEGVAAFIAKRKPVWRGE